MRGHFSDLWSEFPYVDSLLQPPANRYPFEPMLTMPWLSLPQGDNQGAILANSREIPFKAVNIPQPPQTYLQNHELGVFDTGGLAMVPFAGIWRIVR